MTAVGGPRRQAEPPQIRSFGADRIVLRLDGARQDFSSGHKGRMFLDPALLERVEVVRGPSSALFGSGAIGGMIAFETRDARDLLGPEESLGVRLTPRFLSGSDEWGGHGSLAGRTGGFDYLASVSARSAGDVELSTDAELPYSDADTWATLGKVGWQPDDHARIELSYHRFSEESTTPLNAS
ncbi:MAG: TonB-dependent receptor plug domain-containing protein [Gemmatimonadota bacterium]